MAMAVAALLTYAVRLLILKLSLEICEKKPKIPLL